ncbi:MAG: toll/interleukin-1 receptor domain-containing protein [Planctomycetes bacterium]|nr:toll/interleukin-1 receptor domain-containing protein [Planctomycetota bacterium]
MTESRSQLWFVRDISEESPVPSETLRAWASSGKLLPTHAIRRLDDRDWRPASAFRGLFVAAPNRASFAFDAFISYSHKDKSCVDAVVHILESRKIRCWIAPRDIVPGSNWGESIVQAMDSCRVLVLVLSQHSNRSQQILQEVERAVSKGLIVVPFRIEAVDVSRSLELYVGARHWLDAYTLPLEQHAAQLADALERILAKPRISNAAASENSESAAPANRQKRPRRYKTWCVTGLVAAALAGAWFLRDRIPVDAAPPVRTETSRAPVVANPKTTNEVRQDEEHPTRGRESEPVDSAASPPTKFATDEQRAALLQTLRSGANYLTTLEATGKAAEPLSVECLEPQSAKRGALLAVRRPDAPARVVFYRVALVAHDVPGEFRTTAERISLRGWVGSATVDRAVTAESLVRRGPLGDAAFVLLPGSNDGPTLCRTSDGRQFALHADAPAVADAARLDLGPRLKTRTRWTGVVGATDAASTRLVAAFECDRRLRSVRCVLEPEGDPWRPVVWDGVLRGDADSERIWTAELHKVEGSRGLAGSPLLNPQLQVALALAADGDGLVGALGGSDVTVRVEPLPAGSASAPTLALVDTLAVGTQWSGTSSAEGRASVPVLLSVLQLEDSGGYLRVLVAHAGKQGVLASYVGRLSTGGPEGASWPIKLRKAHGQLHPEETPSLFSTWETELVLRAVGHERLVGWCGKERIELARGPTDPRSERDSRLPAARQERALRAFRQGARRQGTATIPNKPPVAIEFVVTDAQPDGSALKFQFKSVGKDAKVSIYDGTLLTDEATRDVWHVRGVRKNPFCAVGPGMFGDTNEAMQVDLRLDDEGRIVGWAGREWIELSP